LTGSSRVVLCVVVVGVAARLAACSDSSRPSTEAAALCDPDDPDPRGPACLHSVKDSGQFDALSQPVAGIPGWERATKYMVPATDDAAAIPALVQNANRYAVHLDFLRALFLPGLDLAEYARLVMERATRQYYAGNLIRINDPYLGQVYGFSIYTSARISELLEPIEVRRVYDRLGVVVGAGPLAYTFEPSDAVGPARARSWIDPGFPISFLGSRPVQVEVYTQGIACGRVRLFTLEQLEQAVASGAVGFRDLVVVDAVPFDVETVVAGMITGQRQWQLSHVNVRLASRGTVNLYVADALAALEAWEGKLVRLEASPAGGSDGDGSYSVREIDQAEAEAWWAAIRPRLDHVAAVDRSYTNLDGLRSMDVDDQPVPLVTRFGGKTANLAKLYSFMPEEYQVPGLGIPFAGFEDCLDQTLILDQRAVPPEKVPVREFVTRLGQDPQVASDATLRHSLLAALRDTIRDAGQLAPAAVEALDLRVVEVFGSSHVPVRFRSSSNVEDSLEFSGAGLYDSTTVCVADDLDQDDAGPSACDPDEPDERGVERGLRHVWASLYNDRAWDERDWYQVPQSSASMAVLVTLAFPDELANGVVFTGDPSDPSDQRYLVNVQQWDEPVVGNDASRMPEVDKLELDGGQVSAIHRLFSSSLAVPGVPVLSDQQLVELGGVVAGIARDFPLELGGHQPEQVLLDLEFKIDQTGQLRIKQIRPFLRPPGPTPSGTQPGFRSLPAAHPTGRGSGVPVR
jgi:hypothetical protein